MTRRAPTAATRRRGCLAPFVGRGSRRRGGSDPATRGACHRPARSDQRAAVVVLNYRWPFIPIYPYGSVVCLIYESSTYHTKLHALPQSKVIIFKTLIKTCIKSAAPSNSLPKLAIQLFLKHSIFLLPFLCDPHGRDPPANCLEKWLPSAKPRPQSTFNQSEGALQF